MNSESRRRVPQKRQRPAVRLVEPLKGTTGDPLRRDPSLTFSSLLLGMTRTWMTGMYACGYEYLHPQTLNTIRYSNLTCNRVRMHPSINADRNRALWFETGTTNHDKLEKPFRSLTRPKLSFFVPPIGGFSNKMRYAVPPLEKPFGFLF